MEDSSLSIGEIIGKIIFYLFLGGIIWLVIKIIKKVKEDK